MVKNISRNKIEQTSSLEEAIKEIFDLDITGKSHIFPQESMRGNVAKYYDELGRNARTQTYQMICEDFKNSTGCYGKNHPATNMQVGTILEIGCGSGLLSLQLTEHTNGYVIGVDLSDEMIKIANTNLQKRSKEKITEIKEFWEKLPNSCKPKKEDYIKLEKNPPLFDSLEFRKGNVSDLSLLVSDKKDINYIVCRNALHRFSDTKNAIQKMYSALAPNGKLYIRDIKRDANWKTILKRIGNQRWKRPCLVKDYIGAMASMLTTKELEKILKNIGIQKYNIRNGDYNINDKTNPSQNLREYASEVEYVCVIKKQTQEKINSLAVTQKNERGYE